MNQMDLKLYDFDHRKCHEYFLAKRHNFHLIGDSLLFIMNQSKREEVELRKCGYFGDQLNTNPIHDQDQQESMRLNYTVHRVVEDKQLSFFHFLDPVYQLYDVIPVYNHHRL